MPLRFVLAAAVGLIDQSLRLTAICSACLGGYHIFDVRNHRLCSNRFVVGSDNGTKFFSMFGLDRFRLYFKPAFRDTKLGKCKIRTLLVGPLMGILILGTATAEAGETLAEDFSGSPETRWDYVADSVMGGVSSGQVFFLTEGDVDFARLTGTVSTENNGGFIQFRRKLSDRPTSDTAGVRIVVRGNGEQYFIHLRTKGTVLPWQYYEAEFKTTESWTEILLPFSSFKASGAMLRSTPTPTGITSIGVVAYGRDHQARLDVSKVSFY